MLGAFKARGFFTADQKERIMDAIRQAEDQTSGEIRVHVETSAGGREPMARAQTVFDALGMARTELRNGVLIYLAVSDRKFAILGDQGINQVVPEHFWEEIKDRMHDLFTEGRFVEGITSGILSVGEHLKRHFPCQSDDVNELCDDISEGNIGH